MSEPSAPQHAPDLQPCLCELGDHVLEIVAEERAVLVKQARLDETVILNKDELYRLLGALQALFQHGTLETQLEEKSRGSRWDRR